MPSTPSRPTFRFAPSPNGLLHLGHALSAITNAEMAEACGGRFLLRLEDIDRTRCRPEFETAILCDLAWLGLTWEKPVRRQSDHLPLYAEALEQLKRAGLVYPAFLTRGEIRVAVAREESCGRLWPRDPDGAAHYPGAERGWSEAERAEALGSGQPHAWRLDMARALQAVGGPLFWAESGAGPKGETGIIRADPAAWGDVVLSRSDAPSSYHLSVVVDDAAQGVTHVVRGRDLFHATAVHRLLQALLALPEPLYHHHRLILGADGRKLSKSLGDTGLEALRAQGLSAQAVRDLLL